MKLYIQRPDITLYTGVEINKDTKLKFENDVIKQSLNELVLETNIKAVTDEYESETILKMFLRERDILLFDNDKGYYIPSIPVNTVKEVIEDLEPMINMGD